MAVRFLGPMRVPVAKRVEDVMISLILFALLLPLFVGAYALLALTMLLVPVDRGPFLYRERRISRGRAFDLLKFRTVRADVLRQADGYAGRYEADSRNLTRAGRVLKRWYLDELPQLVNILVGDMSLVGPRPWPVALLDTQTVPGQAYRRTVPTGWTGPAQVTKGARPPVDGTVLDLAYVDRLRRWSGPRLVLYDLSVLFETVRVLVRGEGLQN
jgi:lipopolysaccharide/colanic/teichoic acid biosynthesis glycosyltransferase